MDYDWKTSKRPDLESACKRTINYIYQLNNNDDDIDDDDDDDDNDDESRWILTGM